MNIYVAAHKYEKCHPCKIGYTNASPQQRWENTDMWPVAWVTLDTELHGEDVECIVWSKVEQPLPWGVGPYLSEETALGHPLVDLLTSIIESLEGRHDARITSVTISPSAHKIDDIGYAPPFLSKIIFVETSEDELALLSQRELERVAAKTQYAASLASPFVKKRPR